jgi:hypothetical protein
MMILREIKREKEGRVIFVTLELQMQVGLLTSWRDC